MNTTFTLDNFEGPLEILMHLIHKQEIDIYEVMLQHLTDQFTHLSSFDVDHGAEFIGITATLMLLKSKRLLPSHLSEKEVEEEEIDPCFEMLQQIIEYCRFKEAAKHLSELEQERQALYTRGVIASPAAPREFSVDPFGLNDLMQIFQKMMKQAESRKRIIQAEPIQIGDKIAHIRERIVSSELCLTDLFNPSLSRLELIVLFLAVLELLKLGEARAVEGKLIRAI